MKQKWLVALHGPTASGKTSLAVELARAFQTHILSADSRQFYRELHIGVARPTVAELVSVPHHFIAFRSIHEPYSAGQFGEEAVRLLHELFAHSDVVITTGGSGLYLKALIHGLDDLPSDPLVRADLQQILDKQGINVLLQELALRDAEYFETVDLNNPHRVIRALEVCRISGQPYSSFRTGKSVERPFSVLQPAITGSREWLYHRINARVEQMVHDGLEAEARALYPFRHLDSLRTVGYTEWFDHMEGKLSHQETIDAIARHTRNYAKRQLTWYRKQSGVHWFDAELSNDLTSDVLSWLKNQMVPREDQ